MGAKLETKRVRVVLYEGEGATALDATQRFETMRALLEDGHPVTRAAAGGTVSSAQKQAAVSRLIQVYSLRGHQIADLDPLGLMNRPMPGVLKLDYLGLSDADMDSEFYTGGFAGLAGPYDFTPQARTIKQIFGPPARYPLMQTSRFIDGGEPPALVDPRRLDERGRRLGREVEREGRTVVARRIAAKRQADILPGKPWYRLGRDDPATLLVGVREVGPIVGSPRLLAPKGRLGDQPDDGGGVRSARRQPA